ncbi:hypothetical protein [Parabacteroides johnsonii]|uniref:hypothetical protein n=1 Tax=Parabacteroides johnsonii TaxID=387661 RepID=UPI0011DE4614|nr:hypothetical protein [Parabacteroides johnsonii]MBP3642434.1 hypothetical protein [Parabacteroides sp.]
MTQPLGDGRYRLPLCDPAQGRKGTVGIGHPKRGLSGWASSEGQRRSVRSLRCLSEASFAGDSGVFGRSSPDG